MALKLITPASTYPVTLAEAKLHCRVDTSDDDALITSLITAATEMAEQELGRAITAQTWEITLDKFPAAVELTRVPVQSVTSVKYYDTAGVQQTLASNLYSVDKANDMGYAYVVPVYGTEWPETQDMINAVAVRYESAFSVVPEPVKQWIKLMIGTMYDNRESQAANVTEMGFVGRLLDRYRIEI